jgi:hypothetical protein
MLNASQNHKHDSVSESRAVQDTADKRDLIRRELSGLRYLKP